MGHDGAAASLHPPCLRGETITWQCFNEPESGSDFAAVNTVATPDGDGWRINGEKAFITGRFDPDYLITLANTAPDRPRRANLGVFMVDANSPGLEIRTMRLLMGSERRVHFDNVYVPDDCRVGPAYQGWEDSNVGYRGGTRRRGVQGERGRHNREHLPISARPEERTIMTTSHRHGEHHRGHHGERGGGHGSHRHREHGGRHGSHHDPMQGMGHGIATIWRPC